MAKFGVEVRTSRPSTWSECRQRGDSVIVGELVMLDLANSDPLTANFSSSGAKGNPGTSSTASSPLVTVLPATTALEHGRVGVCMQATADNGLGLYEFGEDGDGAYGDVIVRALVFKDATSVAGVALEVNVDSGVGRFCACATGSAFATLLEDAATGGGNQLCWVILHTGGKGGGVGGSASLDDDSVTNGKLRDSAALSVIGRGANSTGDPADIAAASDGHVLRRSGTTLAFGTIATAGLTAGAADNTILRDSAGLSVIGRSADSTGDPADIVGTDGLALRVSGTTLGFGTIVAGGIASDAVTTAKILDANVTLAKMASVTAGGTLGRATGAGTGVPTILTAAQLAENAGLDGATILDKLVWDVATAYVLDTLVIRSDALYILEDPTSTGEDPASGAPWLFLGKFVPTGGTTGQALIKSSNTNYAVGWGTVSGGIAHETWWVRQTFAEPTLAIFAGTAITSGTQGSGLSFGASGLFGVASQVSSGAAGSGYRHNTSLTAFEACTGLLFTGRFMVPTAHTDKSVRIGFHDSNSIADPTDGVYIQSVAGTATVYSVSAGTPTASAGTYAVAADTWYDVSIYWTSTTSVVVSMRATGGAMLDTRTITTDLPSGSQQFGASIMSWTPAGAAGVVIYIDDAGFGIVGSHTP